MVPDGTHNRGPEVTTGAHAHHSDEASGMAVRRGGRRGGAAVAADLMLTAGGVMRAADVGAGGCSSWPYVAHIDGSPSRSHRYGSKHPMSGVFETAMWTSVGRADAGRAPCRWSPPGAVTASTQATPGYRVRADPELASATTTTVQERQGHCRTSVESGDIGPLGDGSERLGAAARHRIPEDGSKPRRTAGASIPEPPRAAPRSHMRGTASDAL